MKYFKTSWFILVCVSKSQHSDLLKTSFYNDKGKKEFKGISENSLFCLWRQRLLQPIPIANYFEMDFSQYLSWEPHNIQH